MRKLSKAFYVSVMVAFLPAGVFLLFVLCYKAWESIQDGHARTTPGKAIGFLFVPIYSFYWLFQCTWGFAKDYNQYLVRHSLNARKLPEDLFLAFYLLEVVPFSVALILAGVIGSSGRDWIIGLIWIAGELLGYILGIVMVAKTCDAVNALRHQTSSEREA